MTRHPHHRRARLQVAMIAAAVLIASQDAAWPVDLPSLSVALPTLPAAPSSLRLSIAIDVQVRP